MHAPSRLILLCAIVAVGCGRSGQGPSETKVDFVEDIKPLLESRCLVCHNTYTLLGHLNLETRELAMQPGPDGKAFIIPGKPAQSKFYTFTLVSEDKPESMPPSQHKLSDEEKDLLRAWIAQGAEWPGGPEGLLKTIPDPQS